MKFKELTDKLGHQAFLTALILFLIVPIPITLLPGYSKPIFGVVYSFLIISGVSLLTSSKRRLFVGLGLGVVSFLMVWIGTFSANENNWGEAQSISLLLYFTYMAYFLFQDIAKQKEVTFSIIISSISGYLIIGMIGGGLFQLLEMYIPGSFNLPAQPVGDYYDLHYFSFVTLTTLGYGDISPATTAAKSLTVLISLAGQLYLTILIAALIGKFLR